MMKPPNQLLHLVAIGVLLAAPAAAAQTSPVAVIQTPVPVGGEHSIRAMAISADGSTLAVGSGEFLRGGWANRAASIEMWLLRGGRPPYTFAKDLFHLKNLAFSHDSQWLGAVSQTSMITGHYTQIMIGEVRLWHVADDTETKLKIENTQASLFDEWSATNVAFSPDDKQLVADVFTPGVLPDRGCVPNEPCPDAESVPYDVRTTFFEVATGRAVNSTPLGQSDSAEPEQRHPFWLSSDGRRAFTLEKKLVLVNTLTGRSVSTFKAPQVTPNPDRFDTCEIGEARLPAFGFAAFSTDVKQIAISDGQQLDIVDAKTGTSTARNKIMFAGAPNEQWRTVTATFSPSGGSLAVAACMDLSGTGKLRLYNPSNLQELATFRADTVLTSLAFTPDGTLLFTGGSDGAVRVLDTQHCSLIATLVRSTGGDWIVFTPEGLFDASANGATLLAWRLKGQIVMASELPEMRLPGLLSKLVSGNRPKLATPLTSAISAAVAHSQH